MKPALHFLSATFRYLVLKPLDLLLFNGLGVLYLSHDELRDSLARKGYLGNATQSVDDVATDDSLKGFPNYGLPDVRYGSWDDELGFPPGGWSS